jgi:hypothetical protein
MHLKFYAISFYLLLQSICKAQTFAPTELRGTWHGRRFDVDCYYDFMTDSTYREWQSNRVGDSTKIWGTSAQCKAL